jgi:hypothetical protein
LFFFLPAPSATPANHCRIEILPEIARLIKDHSPARLSKSSLTHNNLLRILHGEKAMPYQSIGMDIGDCENCRWRLPGIDKEEANQYFEKYGFGELYEELQKKYLLDL